MTAKELIEQLQRFDPSAHVQITHGIYKDYLDEVIVDGDGGPMLLTASASIARFVGRKNYMEATRGAA